MFNLFRKKPIPINFNISLLIITDTHNCLTYEELEEKTKGKKFDACLLLGDLSDEDLYIIKNEIKNIPIYGVLGNHYGWDLYDKYNIENIHGKVIEINGIRIAGIQGGLKYKNANTALYTDQESVEIAKKIEPADILISHDSPKHFHGKDDFAHSGLKGITYYCKKNKVPLNIHGHHHRHRIGVLKNGTRVMCCYGIEVVNIIADEKW